MDGSRFDAWTRRRFGLAVGGLAGSLLGIVGGGSDDLAAKQKKKKKRCRKLGQSCREGGKRACCAKRGLSCQPFEVTQPNSARRCCRRGKEPCTDSGECCSGECTDGRCVCKANGQECAGIDAVCCSLNCAGNGVATCQPA